ncbi:MAG: phosphatidylserine decarboxylase [Acidobacteriota bacterium]|nr:phosphatidylserine decarboxylase [Acidobacteriota bacterium]MDH3784567.1 phosphatidylserine decarboxylase [Acidobacteriota bacterium]
MKLDREAWQFVLPLAVVTALAFWWHPLAGLLPLLALLFTGWFFRDPARDSEVAVEGWLAPADGRVLATHPERLSIFMNVFNVHVCRSPIAGRVTHVEHHDGQFLAAYRDDAPDANERTEILVEGDGGPCRFVLVAGLVARRIVCRVRVGDTVKRGDRVGVIRFGSRVDVHFPAGRRTKLSAGDRTVAGETPIA